MKNKILIVLFVGFILSGCSGVSSPGIFGTGVSIAIDPRSLGTQIDDSLMQKNLTARILLLYPVLQQSYQQYQYQDFQKSFSFMDFFLKRIKF